MISINSRAVFASAPDAANDIGAALRSDARLLDAVDPASGGMIAASATNFCGINNEMMKMTASIPTPYL
jgi:hypothetical protein